MAELFFQRTGVRVPALTGVLKNHNFFWPAHTTWQEVGERLTEKRKGINERGEMTVVKIHGLYT